MSIAQRALALGVAALVVAALVLAMVATRPAAAPPLRLPGSAQTPPGGAAGGTSGIGDPYLPQAGGSGYDVQHYDVRLSASPTSAELSGTTTITAVATQDLDWLHLDLLLPALSATVDGRPAALEQQRGDLLVRPARPEPTRPAIARGAVFTVTIEYAGRPQRIPAGEGSFYRGDNEFVIAGEPLSAPLWYPANDHPRDAATFTCTISVPRGIEAICGGRLAEQGADPGNPDRDRWVWQADAPTVTYATMLAVGDYRVERGEAGGRPTFYAVSTALAPQLQQRALQWLRGSPAAVADLERHLGPYPYSAVGGFVPGTSLHWGGLEVAMLPIYHPRMVGSELLLDHELAHMWLGDTVTLTEWNDIFNNESLTTYAQWLVSSRRSPAEEFRRTYGATVNADDFWRPALADPGEGHLFERVYDRGPLVVHALRTRMGDEAFFPFLRAWAQQRGPRSLEDFRRAADEATEHDLTGFFAEWLDQTDRPDVSVENGFEAAR